jgi:integrase
MAKVRSRGKGGPLFLDFYYRGARCREQTALTDTAENRKKVQALLNRIERDIRQGSFDYAATFPGSARAEQFAKEPLVTKPAVPTVLAASVASAPATPTFETFWKTWRAEMAPQWRRLHREGVDQIFEKHLVPQFGARCLSVLTKPDVLTFRAALAELPGRSGKKLSASRINKVMTLLRQMLTAASERYNTADVCRGIKRLKARRPDVHPFSLEEVDRIRGAIREDFRHYVTTRFFTGMRTGEINGLKWKYVDFERGLIAVREVFSSGETEENAKNETSLRDIPMLPIVREALEAQRAVRHPESEYVFCSRDSTPLDAHNFTTRVWYPLLRFLQIEKRRPYQTRHTTATLMLASGENPEWIARLMGHANTQMLFTVYSRFVPNLTRQDGRAITGLLNSRGATASAPSPAKPKDLSKLSRAQLEAMVRSMTPAPKEDSHVA